MFEKSDYPRPRRFEVQFIILVFVAAGVLTLLTGCAFGGENGGGVFDVEPNDCAITIIDADASAGILSAGSLSGKGVILIRRGKCTPADLDLYKRAERL